MIFTISSFCSKEVLSPSTFFRKVCQLFKRDVGLKEKIGQMIMIGFCGTEVSENSHILRVISDVKVGGLILFDIDLFSNTFPRNILNPRQTKKLISDLQGCSSTPLFIAVDAEGGKVNRLKEKYGFFSVPSAKELGERGKVKITEQVSEKLAKELAMLGFNMNFAPVIDVDINSENPVIGAFGRSFSSDPQEVIKHARAFINAHRRHNIINVVKHFPGHGSSKDDSHLGMVDITETYKEEEIIPYKVLQQEKLLNVVMTAHIVNHKIDKNYPVTLSSFFLQDVLREEIGFKGVIISDDMQMGAILTRYGLDEAVIKAVKAGCDIILLSNNSATKNNERLAYKVRDVIYEAVEKGEISKRRITKSYKRICALKKKFRINRLKTTKRLKFTEEKVLK